MILDIQKAIGLNENAGNAVRIINAINWRCGWDIRRLYEIKYCFVNMWYDIRGVLVYDCYLVLESERVRYAYGSK